MNPEQPHHHDLPPSDPNAAGRPAQPDGWNQPAAPPPSPLGQPDPYFQNPPPPPFGQPNPGFQAPPPPPPAGSWPQSPYYSAPGYGGSYAVRVSGGTILAMGIVSLFCFGVVLGPIAWILGNQALAAIDAGQADPGERGNVTAGRVCGIIGTCLNLIGLLIWGLYFLFVAHVMNSFGMRST